MASLTARNLFEKLNPTCRAALEAAAGLCLSKTHFHVEVEHWFLKLFEAADNDIAVICRQYSIDPGAYLRRTFEEVAGYDEMVVLRDISFESFCEHHMAPIIGRAHVGYLPTDRVVGISKLARVVEGYARRFQVQEKLTSQIAACINDVLKPRGVGVVIDAVHQCMTTRGVHKRGVSMVTSKMLGTFRADASTRAEFLRFIDIEGRAQR